MGRNIESGFDFMRKPYFLSRGEKVKIMGQKLSANEFKAGEIRPLGPLGANWHHSLIDSQPRQATGYKPAAVGYFPMKAFQECI